MEEIKELITKIQQEGIRVAQDKAQKIEEEAKKVAADILHKAKTEADKTIREAKETTRAMEAATQDSLKQAGRDMILSLKKEINAILGKIIVQEVAHALQPQELDKIITALIKEAQQKEIGHIELVLNKEDLKKLKDSFLDKLKSEIKKGVVLKPSEDILAGFMISFDQGKSYFDFSDKSLAEYIADYLKPQLSSILK